MSHISSSLTVPFGQSSASDNFSLSGGDESSPAVYYYIKVAYTDPLTRTEHESILWFGSGVGYATLNLDYNGDEAVRLEVIRGSGFITGGGWITEPSEEVIHFAGQSTFPVDSYDRPVILYTSEFRDEAGNLVDAPLWNETIAAFNHEQMVYGAFIVTTTKRFRRYVVYYHILDYVTRDNASGGTLTPLVVAAITNKNFAIATISRSVEERDAATDGRFEDTQGNDDLYTDGTNSEGWEKMLDLSIRTGTTPENEPLTPGQKVEVGREGFVDRVFPTPPYDRPKPPKDPKTGRTDYMDVERTTRIKYSTQYVNQNGVVRKTLQHTESYNNQPPENSYTLKSFSRNDTSQLGR